MAKRNDCYTDEEKDEIIAHVLVNVASGRFVSRVLAEDKKTETGITIPSSTTFWRWVYAADEELRDKLAHARAQGVEALLDECGEIADDGLNDYVEREDRNGGTYTAFDKEHVQRSKLRIETRIKMAQLLQPRKYGPRVDVTSGGKALSIREELDEMRERARQYIDGELPKGK